MANEGFDPGGFDGGGFQTGEGAGAQVSFPIILPNGGVFYSAQYVSISSATVGATLYYTTNGDAPTDLSTEYTGPFELSVDTTVKAIGYADDLEPSSVAVAVFDFQDAPEGNFGGEYIIVRRRKR